jgi:hypothetical protein
MDGRLRAAGSMSGIFAVSAKVSREARVQSATLDVCEQSWIT